ncbi:MAG: RNA polymerase subunit sigma-24 [Flavobacteriales bacterium]|nr:MAG: RNA polymerase subunit sigma-24 [Flavobacteriales bacterium]
MQRKWFLISFLSNNLEQVLNNNITEKDLVEGCIADKRQYQETLYKEYADKMFTVSLTYTDDEDEACDILQEGFIKVFRNLHKFNFEGSFEGWIRKIIVNTALEHYRKRVREEENLSVYETHIEPQIEGILDTINANELIKLVNELPSKAAMVLKLYAIEGYGHKEIAEQMGVTVGTSKSQLNRARFLLKQSMSKTHG